MRTFRCVLGGCNELIVGTARALRLLCVEEDKFVGHAFAGRRRLACWALAVMWACHLRWVVGAADTDAAPKGAATGTEACASESIVATLCALGVGEVTLELEVRVARRRIQLFDKAVLQVTPSQSFLD